MRQAPPAGLPTYSRQTAKIPHRERQHRLPGDEATSFVSATERRSASVEHPPAPFVFEQLGLTVGFDFTYRDRKPICNVLEFERRYCVLNPLGTGFARTNLAGGGE